MGGGWRASVSAGSEGGAFVRRILSLLVIGVVAFALFLPPAQGKKKERKEFHPFDVYDHPKHFVIFAMNNFACDNCHTDPASYKDRAKINRLGCHMCHQSLNPVVKTAPQDCNICHKEGIPRPEFHDSSWLQQHQMRAKAEPKLCASCHRSVMFCVDCHQRRDNIQRRMHDLNFRLYHSVEARANPHKCDACHRPMFCTNCHQGVK